ncbi:MAG: addiction module protein [Cyclobacteriaceae bacterium]
MKLTIDIEDAKFDTLKNFLQTLDYVSIEPSDEIPAWQKEEVMRRKALNEEGKMVARPWSEARKEVFKK